MKTIRRSCPELLLAALAAVCPLSKTGLAADALAPLGLREVQVGGEIGRRVANTITNNLLVLNADRDFLPPFRAKTAKGGYIGLGKLIDATVKFAAYSGDPRVDTLRRHLVAEAIQAQEPDGYIGIMAPANRGSGLWDIHEMGDLIERTIYNALFAAQSPDGRRLRYFSPTEGPREYWATDTYCCPCNYRRIVSELPAMVFYRRAGGVAVDLYTPSQAKLVVAENVPLTIKQETDYPNSGHVRLLLEPGVPARFPLQLRIPAWAQGAAVSVNGERAAGPVQAGTFFALDRQWKRGDEVTLELPMSWRLVKGRQRQAGRVAVMRGPQVFCLNPSQDATLAKLDGTDLGYLALDPNSLGTPIRSDAVRPGGLGCKVSAWKPGFSLAAKADYELIPTEFPDPGGKATYFRLRDFSAAVQDELFTLGSR